MTSAKFSDFLTPTQPPLLRLLIMSAFEGTPLPPHCGRHKRKPPRGCSPEGEDADGHARVPHKVSEGDDWRWNGGGDLDVVVVDR